MEKTKCMTYFAIKGDFKLDDVSKILNLEKTGGFEKGQKRRNGTIYEFSSWEYGTNYEETLDSCEQLDRILKVFSSKIDELNEIRNKYDCNFILEQVPHIYNEKNPAIFFDNHVIDFCSATGTVIDVDIYVYNQD